MTRLKWRTIWICEVKLHGVWQAAGPKFYCLRKYCFEDVREWNKNCGDSPMYRAVKYIPAPSTFKTRGKR